MPVDKQLLEQCILEVADGDQEYATYLRERYAKNEAGAAKFVGGFMRTSDYTKKTTELATQRQQLESQSGQVGQLQASLQAAEAEKDKIMRELATQRISTAKARELMKLLQDKYALTDDDLPGMSDLIETRKTGTVVDSTPDIETRLASFKTELKSELEKQFVGAMTPELGSMAKIPLIWQEIDREHEELSGKRLTFAEKQEIFDLAQRGTDSSMGKGSIYGIWQDKYNIAGDTGLRMQKRDEKLKAEWQTEMDKKNAEDLQRRALEVVTPAQRELGDGAGISAAFKTRFREYDMDPDKPGTTHGVSNETNKGEPTIKVLPGQHVRQENGARIPAAQRAAAKFLERGGTAGYGRKTA